MAALFELLTGYLDAVVSPKTRDRLAQNLLSFALQKPYLASYFGVFVFFAFLPLLGLVTFLVTLVVIIVATLAFWIGVGLVVTACFLTVSATLATFAYLYLVGLFLSARWCKNTFLPASENQISRLEAEQRRHRARREKTNGVASPVKEEQHNHEDEFAAPPNNAASFAEVKKESGPEEVEREKMKRDIARSLQ